MYHYCRITASLGSVPADLLLVALSDLNTQTKLLPQQTIVIVDFV